MKKRFLLLSIFGIIISMAFVAQAIAININSSSGGQILKKPATNVTKAKSTCTSGGTCNGTCSNTWKDASSKTCGKGTFSLNPEKKKPSSAPSDYCVPSSAQGSKNSTISAGKLIVDLYSQSKPTKIGTCTCISGTYCDEKTEKDVYVSLAHISLFGTSAQ